MGLDILALAKSLKTITITTPIPNDGSLADLSEHEKAAVLAAIKRKKPVIVNLTLADVDAGVTNDVSTIGTVVKMNDNGNVTCGLSISMPTGVVQIIATEYTVVTVFVPFEQTS